MYSKMDPAATRQDLCDMDMPKDAVAPNFRAFDGPGLGLAA